MISPWGGSYPPLGRRGRIGTTKKHTLLLLRGLQELFLVALTLMYRRNLAQGDLRAAGAITLPDSTYSGVRQLATPTYQWGRVCGESWVHTYDRRGGVSGRERGGEGCRGAEASRLFYFLIALQALEGYFNQLSFLRVS